MIRARRFRTIILVTGTTLSALIAAAFVVSARWQLAFQFPTSRGPTLYVASGSVRLVTDDMLLVTVSAYQHSGGLGRWNGWYAAPFRLPGAARPAFFIECPLWLPFVIVAVPTLLAWRFWPKPPKPGHCRCGYDLRGNVSGVCPECGERGHHMKRRAGDLRFGKWFGAVLCVMLGAVLLSWPTPFAARLVFGFVLGVPTLLMWWLDRHRRQLPGHCRRCGYDLTSNESGVCPECGVEVQA